MTTLELSNEAWRTYMEIINTEQMLSFSMERSNRLRKLANRAYNRYKRRRDVRGAFLVLMCQQYSVERRGNLKQAANATSMLKVPTPPTHDSHLYNDSLFNQSKRHFKEILKSLLVDHPSRV